MKLAEALILRADCQKRIAQLKSRLLTNAKVQEGDKPAEAPQELSRCYRQDDRQLCHPCAGHPRRATPCSRW